MYKIGGYVKMNSAAKERFKSEDLRSWLDAKQLRIIKFESHPDKKPNHYILHVSLPTGELHQWSSMWLEEVKNKPRNLPEWF